MVPLIKKTLFRMRHVKRPFKSNEEKKRTLFTKEFRRTVVAVLMAILVIGIIYSVKLPVRTSLTEGDIASDDIYAPFNFSYSPGIDEKQTKLKQREASESVLDVYVKEDAPLRKAENSCEQFFKGIASYKDTIAKSGSEFSIEEIEAIKDKLKTSLGVDDIRALLATEDLDALSAASIAALKNIYTLDIVSDEAKKTLLASGRDMITISDEPKGEKLQVKVLLLEDLSSAIESIDHQLSKANVENWQNRGILTRQLSGWITPNLSYSQAETDAERKQAILQAPVAHIIIECFKGEIIIRRGQRVTKVHLLQLDEMSSVSRKVDKVTHLWGVAVLVCILAFLMFIYLKGFEPTIFSQDRMLLLIGVLILFAAISARLVVSSPLSSYLIPVASISMLLALLVNGSVAAIVVMAVSVIVALIAGMKFNIFLVSMIGGISAISTVYNARHRSQIIKSGFYVGILNFVAICALGVIANFEPPVFLREGLWGIANGIMSAAIAMLFLPLFESTFKLTTDIRLLELADLNHPILKSMVMKSSGTYHHSMIVGNLAEAAADAIGANSLLARIGAYYHDIGKIEKAEYFAENTNDVADLHSKLSPSMSSLIITNHVKDGVELAERCKLGSSIKDIIAQHHGTNLVTYFYHQAVEKTKSDEGVSEETFRYPGPKPQSKEAAIVMLADSVEAASRVLQNPAPQNLKELVRKIMNNKIIDRQLDECDLTLKDINKIADTFARVLTGIYHSRVEYPKPIKNKNGHNDNKRSKRDKP